MSGTIGLTKAAQWLDDILTETNPSYKNRLFVFINRFTLRTKHIRATMLTGGDSVHTNYVLGLVKQDYLERLTVEFGDIITPLELSLARNHICALTRHDFIPDTNTQYHLRRKAAAVTSGERK